MLYRSLLFAVLSAVCLTEHAYSQSREASGRLNNYDPERQGSTSVKNKSFTNFTHTPEASYGDLIIYARGGGAIFQQRFIELKSSGYGVISGRVPSIDEITNCEFINITYDNTWRANEGQYDGDAVYGGAIFNSCGDIGSITDSIFTNNTIRSSTKASYGGAIGHYDFHVDATTSDSGVLTFDDHEARIDLIVADFSGNNAIGVTGAYGGAIAANSVALHNPMPDGGPSANTTVFGYNVIDIIAGTFENNKAQASSGRSGGGAISLEYTRANETLASGIYGDFKNNSSICVDSGVATGGALFFNSSLVNTIQGRSSGEAALFSGNKAQSLNDIAYGGAIYFASSFTTTTELRTVVASFESNQAIGKHAHGGAFMQALGSTHSFGVMSDDNNRLLGDLYVTFDSNKAQGVLSATGGAATFYADTHESDIAMKIGFASLTGSFEGNVASATAITSTAKGGALYGYNMVAGEIDALFHQNTASAYTAQGGAMHIENGSLLYDLSYQDEETKLLFSYNKAEGVDASGGFLYLTYTHLEEEVSGQVTHPEAINTSRIKLISGNTKQNQAVGVSYSIAGASQTGDAKGGGAYLDLSYIELWEADYHSTNRAVAIGEGDAAYGGFIYMTGGAIIDKLTSFATEEEPNPTKRTSIEYNFAQSDLGVAKGGAIYLNSSGTKITELNANFSSNYVKGGQSSYGGAMALDDGGYIHELEVTFSGNYALGGASHGGALSLQSGHLYQISSTFLNNYASSSLLVDGVASGGAVYMADSGGAPRFDNVTFTGNFAVSSARSYGGAMTLINSNLEWLDANFSENFAKGDHAYGGALHLSGSSLKANQIHGSEFEENSARGGSSAHGGAISIDDGATITSINTSLISNYAKADHASGGGVYLQSEDASVESFVGVFSKNSAQGESSGYGGAIANNGATIEVLLGDMRDNYTSAAGVSGGGAIANTNGGRILSYQGSMYNNYSSISAEDGVLLGGALYNHNSEFHFDTREGNITISGNYVLNSEGEKDEVAIYNHSTDGETSTIYISGNYSDPDADVYTFTLRDKVDGSSEAVDKQLIVIDYTTTAGTQMSVFFGNEIRNQTINLNTGRLDLIDGLSINSEGALLTNSRLNIAAGTQVYAKGEDFSTTSSFDNQGFLRISGGVLNVKEASNTNDIYFASHGGVGSFISGEGRILVGTSNSEATNLSLSGEALYRDLEDGSREFTQQEIVMRHNYNRSMTAVSQLQLEHSDMLSHIIGSDMKNINLSAVVTDNQSFGAILGRGAEPFRWTVFTWSEGDGLTDEQIAQLNNHVSLSYDFRQPVTQPQWYQTEYALTLTTEIVDVVDAQYAFVNQDSEVSEHPFTISHVDFDQETGMLTNSREHVQYKDILGDDVNLTGGTAHYKGYNWSSGPDGQLVLSDANITVDTYGVPGEKTDIFAYLLGDDQVVNPTADVWYSFAGLEQDGSGGAILNEDNVINKISGDFIGNKIVDVSSSTILGGGAIANLGSGEINLIQSDFVGNRIAPAGNTASISGGALLNEGHVERIQSDFIGNALYSQSNLDANGVSSRSLAGGAIANKGTIDTIQGDFIGNYIYSRESNSHGGALSNNKGVIESVEANFYSNSVTDSIAFGGALSNIDGGVIKKLTGDFVGNRIIQKMGTYLDFMLATGGAVSNTGHSSIIFEDSSFIANYIVAYSEAKGGAIFNINASLDLKAVSKNVYITANHSLQYESGVLGSAVSNGIYNESSSHSADAIINLTALNDQHIVIDDAISGSSTGGRDHQIININSNVESLSSYVAINNKVTQQTLNLKSGTLILGEFGGETVARADGSLYQAQSSTAELISSQVVMSANTTLVIAGAVTLSEDSIIKSQQNLAINIVGSKQNHASSLSGGTLEFSRLDGISNVSLTEIEVRSLGSIHVENCVIGSGVSFSGSSSLVLANSMFTDLEMDQRLVTRSGEVNFSLTALDIGVVDLEGAITLNANMVDMGVFDTAYAAESPIYVYVAGIDLADTEGAYFNLLMDGDTYGLWDATQMGNEVRFLIGDEIVPEPSTVTLSMLALMGLLMRRRRSE